MSKTIVDMPKVAQMFDRGWSIRIWKNSIGSYTVDAFHLNGRVRDHVEKLLRENWEKNAIKSLGHYDRENDFDEKDRLITDDFTPEQALTRMAYKTFGEILI